LTVDQRLYNSCHAIPVKEAGTGWCVGYEKARCLPASRTDQIQSSIVQVERSVRTYRSRFSSYAIAHHLTSSGHYDECEIRFLAPISLLRPEWCTEGWLDLERFKERVRSELKDVEPDVTWKSEVVPLPAFGRYKIDSEIWEFASSPDSVAAAALVSRRPRWMDSELAIKTFVYNMLLKAVTT
jgi:hypothetical protein